MNTKNTKLFLRNKGIEKLPYGEVLFRLYFGNDDITLNHTLNHDLVIAALCPHNQG